jgi:eukaryotic-like serine/threonine-protein kinase
MAVDPNIGQLLIHRYRIETLIGAGAMGRVYRAKDTLLGDVPVAIKLLSQTLLNDEMKLRFAREARTGAQLGQKSIHIVRVIDYGLSTEEVPFYVMEYLAGRNLSDAFQETFALARFLSSIRQVCLGLYTAHQGIYIDGQLCSIVHRDIKPSNILLTSDPAFGELAKVLDFGIAKLSGSNTDQRQTHAFMGTLAYCSPEQIDGQDLDGRSDIYSLGVTMFEVLTGQLPIQADTNSLGSWYKAHHHQPPRSISNLTSLQLPKLLEDLIMGCLAKAPSDRPQTVADILDILEALFRQVGARRKSDRPEPLSPAQMPSYRSPDPVQSIEQSCWRASWPTDKPIAEIVFAKTLQTEQKQAVALWAMLSRQEVQRRLISIRYNQFLYAMAPHPMILWITAIYDSDLGARWLPCYLDLKHPPTQAVVQRLSQTGYYPLLVFSHEDPQHCANVKIIAIAPYQRHLLQDWLRSGLLALTTGSPNLTKQCLKAELEKIKPQILQKLQTTEVGVKLI